MTRFQGGTWWDSNLRMNACRSHAHHLIHYATASWKFREPLNTHIARPGRRSGLGVVKEEEQWKVECVTTTTTTNTTTTTTTDTSPPLAAATDVSRKEDL
ncbi:hypothetical protein E2C01_026586 [Portunus trituberculatus]|uniref:Uncharacterized protein n=1 Tax=Portunus trituberculatus TaxID=210409 RepID=A0A5B7EJK8_PORTR|nr:hypothetical protein [Portunus trituberculatus]